MDRSKMMTRVIAAGVVLVVLQLAAAGSAMAQEEFTWLVRGHYVHVWPGSDTLSVENPVGQTPPVFTEFYSDGGNGFNGEVEYLMSPRIGLFGGLTFANMKTNLEFRQGNDLAYSNDRVDLREINVGANYHFLPGGRLDFYAGALLSWVGYSSSTFNFSQVDYDYQVKYDDELSWGINAGLDIPFGQDSSWFGSVQARYMFLALEGDNNVYSLTVDPVQGYFGIGYRW
jgi:outer membrane protein W